MTVNFVLNGKPVSAAVAADAMLLPVLRELGCKSIKCSCETTNCGCCTVWVNGEPALSCAYPAARAEGMEITTLEGLQAEAQEFAAFMANEGADQCGFCNPGFVMNLLALVRRNADPTDEEIRLWMAGNLCRCTGFASQHRAIRAYIDHCRKGDVK